MAALLDRIETLLAAPPGNGFLPEIEHTLTDGYAHALSLEGERLRVERRIDEVTAGLDGGETERRAAELSLLTRRLASIDEDLSSLRGRLSVLRGRARELRLAPLAGNSSRPAEPASGAA